MNLPLTLETLGDLDTGSAKLIIEKAMAEAVADVDDRGEDGKPRKVVVELSLTKRADGLVEAHVAAQAKLPPRRTASTVARPVHRGDNEVNLLFEFYSPENPDQTILPTMENERK